MSDHRFIKYKIRLERQVGVPAVRKEWKPINAAGDYGYTPETPYEALETTEVLNMEWTKEIDLRKVIKAILEEE